MKIGAQLFTLRDFCKTTEDFSLTLKKVADIGYKYVQVSGVCEYDAAWLKSELDKNGLKCAITHIDSEKLINNIETVITEHNQINCKYVGLGWYSFSKENVENELIRFVDDFTPVSNKLKAAGKYFMYHNHAHEFMKYNNKIVLEHLAEKFDPDSLGFTLDTYWIQAGGSDPAYWVERLSGRTPCIHLKDYSFDGKMAPVGEGNINFDRVFQKASATGVEYMLVEQDDCNSQDPFDCLKRSFEYLRSRGF